MAVVAVRVAPTGGGEALPRPTSSTPPAPSTPSAQPPPAPPGTQAGIPPAPQAPGCTAASAIAELPLRQRLAQLLMVGVDTRAEAIEVVRDKEVGGIFLTGEGTALLTGGALEQVQDAATIPVAVAVDDEGGRVQRLDKLEGELPSAREMAQTMTPRQVYELARQRGAAMRDRGVTVDLAPVVDVSDQPDDAVIGDRSFSDDPQVVTRYAGAFARGLRAAGVLPVFKHFPGHGRAEGDSHEGKATTPPLDELRRVDLVPYRQLLDEPAAVMVGHLDVPGLTEPATPTSISPDALALLREELGFGGLVISDDLAAMQAITDRVGLPAAVRRSLAAGSDVALSITDDELGEVLDHLEGAVAGGTLTEQRVNEAVERVLAAKGVDPCALTD
ncbi:MAG: glycoside hydrolase family 3 protein [Pseudonocardiaceae bacterium]|nr:glycoside hydrolase family 3 protein [Pseudonocardiaceae bacterium]